MTNLIKKVQEVARDIREIFQNYRTMREIEGANWDYHPFGYERIIGGKIYALKDGIAMLRYDKEKAVSIIEKYHAEQNAIKQLKGGKC